MSEILENLEKGKFFVSKSDIISEKQLMKTEIEKLRLQAVESIDNARYKTIELPIYKGDNSLRQSSIDYIKLISSVFSEDYARIVNMEEIAEQSFDEMQAYLLIQQKTDEKISEASAKMTNASNAFAAKYNVTVVHETDELSEKLNEGGKLNNYRNKIFLIFFKCNWQEEEIVKAFNTSNLTKIEQGRSSLIRYAAEGLSILDTLKPFKGDPSLASSCKRVLVFYKKMAETDLPKETDYLLKKEEFDKMQKAFEKKTEHTKPEVNAYNDGVKDLNKSLAVFNATINRVNADRNTLLNAWNEDEKTFLDMHMPFYRK